MTSLPVLLGTHFDTGDEQQRLEVVLNGRDVSALLATPGPRRPTRLRPVARGWEAYAELSAEDGVRIGENRWTARVRGAEGRVVGERSQRFRVRPGPLRIGYRIVERAGDAAPAEVPARLYVFGLDGTPTPDFGPADPGLFAPRDPTRPFVNSASGRGELTLPRGRYRLLASRGLRYGLAEATVGPDPEDVTLELPLLVRTPGEVAADLHVHAIPSGDSAIPLRMRVESFLATDVDVFVASDHNHVTAYADALAAIPGAADRLRVISGTEASFPRLGHWNVWPLSPQELETVLGTRDFAPSEERPARLFDLVSGIRAAEGRPLVSLNHPLGIENLPVGGARDDHGDAPRVNENVGYLLNAGYDPSRPVPEAYDQQRRTANDVLRRHAAGGRADNLAFDLVELYNRNDHDLYLRMRDIWFSWLDQGIRRTAVGNSDTHTLVLVRPGLPRNMVAVGSATPDAAALNRALRAGRSYATTGPLLAVEAFAGGARTGLGATLAAPGGRFELAVTVRAAPWVPVAELRVYANHERVHAIALEPGGEPGAPIVRFAGTLPVELPRGGWVMVEAGAREDGAFAADGDYARVAPGATPVAFTNPIFIEASWP